MDVKGLRKRNALRQALLRGVAGGGAPGYAAAAVLDVQPGNRRPTVEQGPDLFELEAIWERTKLVRDGLLANVELHAENLRPPLGPASAAEKDGWKSMFSIAMTAVAWIPSFPEAGEVSSASTSATASEHATAVFFGERANVPLVAAASF
jgi:hypothetical protein